MIRQSGLKQLRPLFRQAEEADVFAEAGKIFLPLPLVLDAEQIDHVAVGSTSSRLCETVTPSCSNSRGTSVLGPTSVTRAPSFRSAKMFERATRLKRMSPTIATCSPAIDPFFSRMVKRSSSACVGCSCAPSPALMMLALKPLGEKLRRARRAVPQDDDIGVIGFENFRGVLERFAFRKAGSGGARY